MYKNFQTNIFCFSRNPAFLFLPVHLENNVFSNIHCASSITQNNSIVAKQLKEKDSKSYSQNTSSK